MVAQWFGGDKLAEMYINRCASPVIVATASP
jgi:hypothetical protein